MQNAGYELPRIYLLRRWMNKVRQRPANLRSRGSRRARSGGRSGSSWRRLGRGSGDQGGGLFDVRGGACPLDGGRGAHALLGSRRRGGWRGGCPGQVVAEVKEAEDSHYDRPATRTAMGVLSISNDLLVLAPPFLVGLRVHKVVERSRTCCWRSRSDELRITPNRRSSENYTSRHLGDFASGLNT
jgi:hypothetical protein